VSNNVIHVSEQEFEEQVLNSEIPVLVDYWAEWCGPCKMIEPIINELADNYNGQVRFAKVNIDENRSTAMQYNVRGIPTLMVFRDGKVQGTKVGAVTKGQLQDFIDDAVKA
jgi:thioredoxin 1